MATTLIHNAAVLTMDAANTIHEPGWVWLDGAKIGDVGGGDPPVQLQESADRVIDGRDKAVLPGLVNAHTHLSQTFMRGLGDEKTLLQWLKTVMWPLQAAMTPEDVHLASLLGLVENVRSGATTVAQHHKIVTSPDHVRASAEAAATVGVRFELARSWVDLGAAGEPPEKIIDETGELVREWHGTAAGRITVAFGPMAPWRCSDEMMRRTVALAREWDIATHIHVAEAQDEIDLLRQRTGLRHVEWLEALNVLGPDLQLVHCVHLTEAEIDKIADSGATVVHCPTSNMYLASGIAPVPAMLQQGISVALGTDGSASHNSQDLLETAKTAALLARVGSGEATALTPLATLRMMTTAGAAFLRRSDLGQLVPGYEADLTIVDLNTTRAMPVHRPESALVFNSSGPDVDTVIVAGRILLDGGQLTMLDEGKLIAECRDAARRLLQRAGVTIREGATHGA